MTALELISGSLRLIGVLATKETPPATESADPLLILNQMVDSWNSERPAVFSITKPCLRVELE